MSGVMGRRLVQEATNGGEEENRPIRIREEEEEKLKMEVEEGEIGKEGQENVENGELQDPVPVGKVVRVSGKGKSERKHYNAFDFDGVRFQIEDPVLITPEEELKKPLVAIIKDIAQIEDGTMTVTGQCFYRPEEAAKKGGGNWKFHDARELFYSFHREEVLAMAVMHVCVVHFVPYDKQWPNQKKHPGFIVQNVYDTVEKKLQRLTDKDYDNSKQKEIDTLVEQTLSRVGGLPDIEGTVAEAHPRK